MFKDDRLISVMSGVILMIAVGTVVQRGDVVLSYLGMGQKAPVLNPDQVTAMANDLVQVDVLANDEHMFRGAGERLVVATEPTCGRVFVQDGALQYLPVAGCEGQVVFEYRLDGVETAAYGEVVATVIAAPEALPADRTAPEPARDASPEIIAQRPAAAQRPAGPLTDTLAEPNITDGLQAPRVATASQPIARGASTLQPAPAQPERPRAAPITPADTDVALAAPAQQAAPPTAELDAPPVFPDQAEIAGLAVASQPTPQFSGEKPDLTLSDESIEVAIGTDTLVANPTPTAAPELREPEVAATLSLARIGRGAFDDAPPAAPEIGFGPEELGGATPRADLPAIDSSGSERIARVDPGSSLDAVREIGNALEITPIEIPTPSGLAAPLAEGADGDNTPLAALDPTAPIADTADEEQASEVPPQTPRTETPGTETPTETPTADAPATDPDLPAQAPADSEIPIDPDQPAVAAIPIDPDQPAVAAEIPIDPDQPAIEGDIPMDPDQAAVAAEIPIDPDQPAQPVPNVQRQQEAEPQVASLPNATDECLTPPAVTVDPQSAGRTELTIVSPCHAGRAVEIAYSGLRLGIPIGADGRGALVLPGFQDNAPAQLRFPDETAIDFELPFRNLDRVHRVAVVWDLPVRLELHAQEFGAPEGSAAHVRPDNPRSYENVRRTGGGYLERFRPVGSAGQNARVYTFIARPGGPRGVITMAIDFVSRQDASKPETCGSGALAAPRFSVVRSAEGVMEVPQTQRIGAVACDRIANLPSHLIGDAVKNVIISRR